MQSKLEGEQEKVTSNDVVEALNGKFRSENYLKFREFDEFSSGRRVDLLAVSLVRSRPGVHGVEIKVSRSDWLREMNMAKKADAFYFCDFYYLASPPGVWQSGEVPHAWGIMEIQNGKVKVLREPTRLNSRYDFMFLKTLIGRMLNPDLSALQKRYNEGYDQGRKDGEKSSNAQMHVETLKREIGIYEENFKKFKDVSGMDLPSVWSLGDIGEIVKKVQSKNEAMEEIERFSKNMDRFIDRLQRCRKEIDGREVE